MLTPEEADEIRERLHRAVDAILDAHVARHEMITYVPTARRDMANFTYTWPDGKFTEEFDNGTWYSALAGETEIVQLLIARTAREAWGRQRTRYVVFMQKRKANSTTLYPLTEFVEGDMDGAVLYGASIPDPMHPQQSLKVGDDLPDDLMNVGAGAMVMPTAQVFGGTSNAKTVRRVVSLETPDGFTQMLAHAFWVGRLRRKF